MTAAFNAGIKNIQLSLSHGDGCVIAIALGVSGDRRPTYTL